jgi:hypothetical protein
LAAAAARPNERLRERRFRQAFQRPEKEGRVTAKRIMAQILLGKGREATWEE